MKWYTASTRNHQGLIVEEETGENIAVSYKKEDANLIASAPDLLEAHNNVIGYIDLGVKQGVFENTPELKTIKATSLKAINKAKGE